MKPIIPEYMQQLSVKLYNARREIWYPWEAHFLFLSSFVMFDITQITNKKKAIFTSFVMFDITQITNIEKVKDIFK